MRSVKRSVKRYAIAQLATISFLLLLLIGSAGPVMAAQDALTCPADRLNSPGNICTASDVSLAAAAVAVSQTGLTCAPGETIDVAIAGTVNLRKGQRYDIGVWVSTDGKPMNLRGGTNGAPQEGGAQSCEVVPLPFQQVAKDTDPGVFIIDSLDDAATPQDCYDTQAANNGDESTGFVLTSNRDSIINGLVDSNNDGVIDGTDDTTADLKVFGVNIIAGGVDIDDSGVIDATDDGIWNRFAVQDGIIDVDGDGNYGEVDGSDDSSQAYNDLVTMLCVAGPTGKLALETLVSWAVPSDADNVCDATNPDSYDLSSSKCSVESSEVDVDIVGKLTIGKIALPDDGTEFEFTYTNDSPPLADQDPNDLIPNISPASPFNLGHLDFDEIYAEIGTGPATIVITETNIPAGWDLADLTCSGDDDVATVIDLANKTATVTLQYNDANALASQANVICSFNNKTLPSLTVVKNTAGGNGVFGFVSSDPINGFDLDTGTSNTAQTAFSNLQPGTDYGIVEVIPDGWSLSSASCSNGSGTFSSDGVLGGLTNISLELGENVTCTFNNALGAVTTLSKITVGGDDSFDFTSTLPDGNFSLTTSGGSSPLASVTNLAAGTYTITEDPKAGWELTDLECTESVIEDSTTDIPSRTITLNVQVGETISCTVTNEKHGSLTVIKQTLPNLDPASFTFTGTVAGSISDGGNLSVSGPAGVFTTNESALAGWDLTNIACFGDTNSTILIGGTAGFVAGDTEVSATIVPGEDIICTYLNTKRGSVTIVKSISAVGPAVQDFDFTSDIPGNLTFTLSPVDATTDDQREVLDLVPGLYDVSEDDPNPDGWALISSSCDDGSPVDGILLDPGEDVTCTFINAPLGSATVVKTSVGGDGQFDFFWGTGANPSIPEGEASTFSLTTPGPTASMDFTNKLLINAPYDLTETDSPPPVGSYVQTWNLTDTTCVDATGNTTSNPGENGADATLVSDSGETVACTFTNTLEGTLVIRKQTIPDQFDQDFTFTGTVSDLSGTLKDNDIASAELSHTSLPGTFGSTETVPAGWALTDISCSGATSSTVSIGGTIGFVDGDTDVSVNLAAGETVICTFTNTKLGSLSIVKNAVGDDGVFTFNHNVPNADVASPFDIITSVDPLSVISTTMLPGSYLVSEVVPTNWDLNDIACSGNTDSTITIGAAGGFDPGDTGVTVDLLSGEDIVCTFTNTADGSLVAVKSTVPGGDPQLFNFIADTSAGSTKVWDTSGTNLTSLADGDSDSQTGQPGIYQIFELVTGGYEITNITCTGETLSQIIIGELDSPGFDEGDAYVTVTLEAGEVVTCDFENTKQATIIVEKLTDPGGAPDAFSFTGDVAGSITGGQTLTTQRLSPGQYQSIESAADGWDLTSVTCDDDNSLGDTVTRTATFNAEAGETVKCTFTNTIQRGKIIVDKVTLPANSTQSFTFFTNYGGGRFNLTDTAIPNDSGDLLPSSLYGTPYSVVEQAVDGWAQTSAVCTGDIGGAKTPDAIDLLPGETVNCTFTNTIDSGKIVVDKITSPSGSSQSFAFVTNYGGLGFSLTDTSVPNDSGNLLPTSEFGTPYSVIESPVAGWTQTFVACNGDIGGAKEPGAILLLPGETVTCSFTNTIQPGQIVVDKQTAPTGSPQLFDFTLTGTNTNQAFQLADASTAYNSGDLLPTTENGTYNVAESLPADWTQDTAICDDGSPPSAVNLSPGETVICTFSNVQAGVSTFTKVTIGGDDTFTFTADAPIGNFSLTTSNGISPSNGASLDAGSYTVTEDILAGWQLTDMVCTESGVQDSVIDIPNRTITLNVEEGETINCTVTNTKLGSITVSKATIPTGDPTSFTFAGDVAGSIADGGTIVVADLLPGVYTSTESAVTGWDLTGILCDDGTSNTPSTGDVQTLTATFNLDAGQDVTCQFTNTLLPIINLAKTLNGPAVLEANGTYTVGYTITASNSGGPGTYDLVDTFSPGAGITLNTASAVYLAGTENSQNGVQAPYPNFVTGEGLDTGLNESWIVTANFTVDPALLDPATSKCDPAQPVTNTGFYNAVSGSDTETDTTDNATCTGLEDPAINLAKTVNGPAVLQADGSYVVEYTITATNTGGPGTYDLVDTFSPGAGITLNTATAIYVAGTESTQTGITGTYPNFVTTEGLGQGLNESWRVVANFTVDPTLLDPASSSCEPATPVVNTGFYNYVEGSVTDVDLTR